MLAITNGGAIPESALYTVVAQPEGIAVGTVAEDFAVESMGGDVFLLGNTSWRISRVESGSGRVLVEDARGAAPNIPFWLGEAPARTPELSAQVSEIREKISEFAAAPVVVARASRPPERGHPARDVSRGRDAPATAGETPALPHGAIGWLKDQCGLDDAGAEQAVEYMLAGRAMLGAVPTQNRIIAERFFDEGGGMQLIIHAPFGGRINKAWGLALRKRFCRSFNFELQAAATEDGLNISLGEQHSFPLADVFYFLVPESAPAVLEQAALVSPIFATRWRWDATRALALPRFRNGKKIPLQIQRMRADDLLAAVFPDAAACQDNIEGDIRVPDHPLVREVMKDVLTEALDLEGLKRVLRGIGDGSIRCIAVDTPAPSPFAHEILNANPYAYLDDAPLEERRARAVSLRRALPETVLTEIGRLDPAAIAQVREEAWPDVRDADELNEVLQVLVALPENFSQVAQPLLAVQSDNSENATSQARVPSPQVTTQWGDLFRQLVAEKRAARALVADDVFWVVAEKIKAFSILFPGARFETRPAEIDESISTRDDALLQLVRGWMEHSGPIEVTWLAHTVGLPGADIEAAMLRLEGEGRVLRGQFTGAASAEWCDRRLLARIHRLTLGTLRREIQPVTRAQFMRWLLRWQHAAPGTQVKGEWGVLEVIRQLQGFEAPASAWEPHILAPRVAGYDPQLLDQLCLTGAVGWGRLSPHPATCGAGVSPAVAGASRSRAGGRAQDAHATAGETPALRSSADSMAPRRISPSSVAPIAFFVREESDWMMPRHASLPEVFQALSPIAQEVLEFIRQRGASFFADIVRVTGRLKSEVETALWELVAAGLFTADGFDNLRALIDPKRRAGQGRGRKSRPRHSTGRWSLLFSGETADRTKAVEAVCRVLLERYGVVFRELTLREEFPFKWSELLIAFRRFEDRGEVRAGRFVDGLLGEQFALPAALESLRAARRAASEEEARGHAPLQPEIVTLSAADPLNLVGIIVPGERVPAVSGKTIALRDGTPIVEQRRSTLALSSGGA
jgi:ATP-dependent Lhr-like helicase